ncbi:GAF domain-containing protein [Chryseolinea lacunae]|uniref:GAF domain-containing protein n=1 Tax=Chryseolinea lacunae TaxID=2801331 RepID=A0ABS1KPG0_9BACT|nr:GAF domain-containing protein [Chryseolinea lacunae]MBL0740181.1 GAF domain-containing protein [Chryseolinea lacunae]
MKDFILGLRIRIKLLAAFGSLLLLSVLLIIFSVSSIDRIIYFKGINEKADLLKLQLETMDLALREFIYEGYKSKSFLEQQQSPVLDSFMENYAQAKIVITQFETLPAGATDRNISQTLIAPLDSLQQNFQQLVALLKTRGFKDYGLEGTLRKAIHNVENSGVDFDKSTMLMLRRHEKDFFLRKDLKYLDEFNQRFDIFSTQLTTSGGTALLPHLQHYKTEFNNVVAIEKQIGLTEDQGLRGRIKNYFTVIRPHIEAIRTQVKERNEAQIDSTQWILWIIFSVQIVVGIAMALVYANLLTRSIKEIRSGMQKLAAGIFPDKLHVLSTEEIGQTKMAFNQFIDRLRAATTFAERLGSGDLGMRYEDQYANDVLARSLVSAQEKLNHAEEHQRKINWMNEGMARFNDVLKNEAEALETVGDRILKLMVDYLHTNQGALYILQGHDNDRHLERLSTYAYAKKKFTNDRVTPGTGLIGQCVLEGETIYLKDVPDDFIKITSGLGEATPRNIVLVPLQVRKRVMGVLELASFKMLLPHEVEFVERIAESIATLLLNKQTSSETRRLLEESRQRADVLSQKEELMRENAEELLATQEEMHRQREALEAEIRSLKQRLALAETLVES